MDSWISGPRPGGHGSAVHVKFQHLLLGARSANRLATYDLRYQRTGTTKAIPTP